jgi:hypothetical protein
VPNPAREQVTSLFAAEPTPHRGMDAIIPNTPEAELMVKCTNVQIAAWCHFYWKETNLGGERFYRKLVN